MKLTDAECDLFFQLNSALLVFVNRQLDIHSEGKTPESFEKLPLEQKFHIAKSLYSNIQLIDRFCEENPFSMHSHELEIVRQWKHFMSGRFYIFRELKKYTVFLTTETPCQAFGVHGLRSDFSEMVGNRLPVLAEIVLLPFKDKIVTDGFMQPYSIYFGGGVRASLNKAYQNTKTLYGIITTLPISADDVKASDEVMLRFYLKNKTNRLEYYYEINKLRLKNRTLQKIYHEEMGKLHARILKQKYRDIGMKPSWYAILENVLIAGGKSREQVEQIVADIVPKPAWAGSQ